MGRAINKTVTIVELIKVIMFSKLSEFTEVVILDLDAYLVIFTHLTNPEEDCWSSPNHVDSIN